MATNSKVTKKYKRLKRLFHFISLMLTIGPLLFYIISGIVSGDIHQGQKLFLGFTTICAGILFLFNIMCKHHLRSPFFLLILGIYFAIGEITPLLIIMSITTCLDEFIANPLYKKYKDKCVINGEIDKRL